VLATLNQPVDPTLALTAESETWQVVKDSQDITDFEAFLAKFPDGDYALAAKLKLKQLRPKVELIPIKPTVTKPKIEVEAENINQTVDLGTKNRLTDFLSKQNKPRTIIYAIDISSSMLNLNPLRLTRVRTILQDSLRELETEDRFNILTFGEEVKYWRDHYASATQELKAEATIHFDTLVPKKTAQASDTDMLYALKSMSTDDPSIIVLFSDGILTTAGIPDSGKIKNEVPAGTKVFAMGAEMSADFPGAVIMRTLAEQSEGEFWLVGESEEQKPNQQAQVMTSLRDSALSSRRRTQATQVTSTQQPQKITWQKDGAKMVLIPAGSFQMGDSKNEPDSGMKRLRPVHTVELDRFYMDVHEVTVGQFREFVNQSGYKYGGNWNVVATYSPGDEYPMVEVTWNDVAAYAKWAGKRLPTEAEWEYAARGGLIGKRYPWGDEITHDDANYNGTGGKDKWDKCSPVGSFEPNEYGLYDTAGNVWEWCADRYGGFRGVRSGSWNSVSNGLRVAYSSHDDLDVRTFDLGFRCVSSSLPSGAFTISSINFALPSPDHRTSLMKQRQLLGQMKMEQRIQIHKEQSQSQPSKAVGKRFYNITGIDLGRGILHEPKLPKVVGKVQGGVVRLSFVVKPNGTVYQVRIIENHAGELGPKARIFVSQIIFNKLASNLPQQDDSGEIAVQFEQQ
jgi:formylglycine-generating enzyme required for sulfatase activity